MTLIFKNVYLNIKKYIEVKNKLDDLYEKVKILYQQVDFKNIWKVSVVFLNVENTFL